MALLSTKNNYLCGVYFTGEAFLVLEFDNKKNKKTVRTKGEISVTGALDDKYEIVDKILLIDAAKRIRKNTKSNTIYINKKLSGVDLSHFFEIFSVAGFERVKFIEVDNILNDAFRKKMIHGEDCFCLIENDRYTFYISTPEGASRVYEASSLANIDFNDQDFKKNLSEVLDSRIEIFGLKDFGKFGQIESFFFDHGYKAVLGNVWQNCFAISSHVPSIHKNESSYYALPIALALASEKQLEDKEGKINPIKNSIADELSKTSAGSIQPEGITIEKEENIWVDEEKEKIPEPKILEEKVTLKSFFNTEIHLPIFEKDDDEAMATYVPDVDMDTFEFETWTIETKEEENTESEAKEETLGHDGKADTDQKEEKAETEGEETPQAEVFVEEATQEDQSDFDFDEMMEPEKEEEVVEVEADIVADSKVIKEKKKTEKKAKKKKKEGFWTSLFKKKKKDLDSVKPKKNKKKAKNKKKSKKHKKDK